METYPIKNKQGDYPFAFEIENVYVGPSAISRLLMKIDGVTDVRIRKMFRKWEDVHVWFKYANLDCVVWEPYGDSSRYWIGLKDPEQETVNMSSIENAFKSYRPPFYRKVIGDILTLRLFKINSKNSNGSGLN